MNESTAITGLPVAQQLHQLNKQLIYSHQQLDCANQQLQQYVQLDKLRSTTLKLIASSQPLAHILHHIVKIVELEHQDMICSILLLDETEQHLTIGAALSLPHFYNDAIEGIAIGYGVGSCGTAAYLGQRVIVEDIANHEYWKNFTDLAAQAQLGACWSEPIMSSSDKVIGTFAIYHRHVCAPTKTDFNLIEQSANLVSIAVDLASANDLIWQQSHYDSLTGLANRQYIYSQLNDSIIQAQRNKTKLAVIHLDLDNFKEINNSLGHNSGDLLLIETAKRIAIAVRKSDHIARIGGDEFTIIMSHLTDIDDTEVITKRLLSQLSRPFMLDDKQLYLSASMGITFYPDDAGNIDNLMKNAEQAMYSAKAFGRGCYQYFNTQMREKTLKRISLINDMRNAITNNEFSLAYQPIIDLNTGELNKVEALLRWQHPTKGNIPPLDFIPLAEETGLITKIGNWVFTSAIQQINLWRNSLNPTLQVSINTSPVQYNDDSIEKAIDYIQQHNLDPSSLIVEITESLLIESTESVANKLAKLRQQGIEIAIDDFGTGYASLSYLKKFKVDYLKIDKSFVWNMHKDDDDRIICDAVLMMANRMGLKVVAEGIETKEQFYLLRDMGCGFGQGYYMAKPLSIADFEDFYIAYNSKQHQQYISE